MLAHLDLLLMDARKRLLAGWRRGVVEFLMFGVKQRRWQPC